MKPTMGSATSAVARTLMRTRMRELGSSMWRVRPCSSSTAMPMICGAAVAEAVVDIGDGLDDLGRLHRPAAARLRIGGGFEQQVGGILLGHRGEVFGDHAVGFADIDHAAVIEPQDAVADGLDVADGMRDEEDGDAALAEFVDLAHAALAEVDVADGEGFIHQQDFGIDVDGDGEGQAHHHAAGVGLDRLIDEVADLGEGGDVFVALVDLARGEAQDRAVEIDVIAAAEFGVEAGAEFEQGGDAAVDRRPCRRWGAGCRRPSAAGCFCRSRFRRRCRRFRRA